MRTVDDLVTWLRAQLDDDEREWLPTIRGARQNGKTFAMRMLREVDAKRRILDEIVPLMDDMDSQIDGEWGSGHMPDEAYKSWALVKLLALPYAHRPGYREDWLP